MKRATLEIHQTRRFRKQLQAMYKTGKKERNIARRAERILFDLQADPLHEETECRRTHYGEHRLRACRKYDLSCGFRLVGLKRYRRLIFTCIGSHDDCQRWIENHREHEEGIESTTVPSAFNHVYRKDLLTGAVELVSSNKAGEAGNADSGGYGQNPISADGRYIAFVTKASNLLSVATGVQDQVFRKDMVSGELSLISANASGVEGDDWSWRPSMTPDGCFITFYSYATDLVSAPATGGFAQVYRRDMDCFPWTLFIPPATGMGKK